LIDGPLTGTRVVELTEGVAGPMTGRLLGDAGADVIKVETSAGDRTRGWVPQKDGTGVAFITLNRNKRSIVLDHKSAEFSALIDSADVLVVDQGLLEVASVMAESPRVIVCVISGWGSRGPWANRPGGELVAQMAAEATLSLGRIAEEPVRIGTDHASIQTALHAMQAITAALFAFEGTGQRIDVSLFGSLLNMRSTMWAALSNPDSWRGFHLDSYVKPPEYGYTCRDRRIFFSVGRVDDIRALLRDLKMDFVVEDSRWPMFSRDVGGGLGQNSHLVHDLWDQGLHAWTFAEAAAIIESHGGFVFPFFTFEDFVADAHVQEMGLITEETFPSGTPFRDLRPPWIFSETPASIRRPAPTLDQHGSEVRSEIAKLQTKLPD
jgi:crotonobetainyl-CoA:carnitine CoA-transferase CaiB-like acyl-CoA transferase